MPFSQKYTIVQLLEPLKEGTEYAASDWPLHVTLADIFATDWSTNELIWQCEQEFATYTSLTTQVTSDEWFGPEKDVHVTLLDKTPELQTLHEHIVEFLGRGNAVFNTPQFTLAGFKPHVTVIPSHKLHEGDKVAITALTIIDMFPDHDHMRRKVLKTIRLKHA